MIRFFDNFLVVAAAALLAALSSASASAHHSFAGQFDANQPVSVEGIVTRVEWQNPHVWFYVDAEEPLTSRNGAMAASAQPRPYNMYESRLPMLSRLLL